MSTRDPRPGRRPRNVPTGGTTIAVGDANGEPIQTGFAPEPIEPIVGGVASEADYRAPASASRAERVPAKNLTP
jgi:hypothetical protein